MTTNQDVVGIVYMKESESMALRKLCGLGNAW